MPERLPPNPFDSFSGENAAYKSCLNLEAFGGSWSEFSEAAIMFKFSPEVAARVLGYALIHSPKVSLAGDISSCNDNVEFLAGLSYLYVMGVIRTFRNPKGAIPMPQTSQATADNVEVLSSQLTASASNAKQLALARDNYRCILSGNVNIVNLCDDLTTINVAAGERRRNTVLAHIFGQSTADNILVGGLTGAAQRKLAWAASAADVVERFADISIVKELNQNNIHKPENTFTVSPEFHGPFDELQFSLHPVGPDTYEIHTYPSDLNAEYGLPDRVTLKDATGGKIPLPAVVYFQLHDVCAKIAHLSGAGEVVEQLFRDLEDVQVLAEDGGSHYLLSLALLSHSGAEQRLGSV
ncbi:hypothetical protein ARMGADRAFT_1164063 [Armillaria gallica]|uniref:HNH nuclease domain-containing protein n=1 Tax=Armillaria gallica TaxID=47427 RepID=A0A2H3DNQ4_ARMGA|nr:hypothetical protein ARMGADRAFT_1164063 [Armillaria gallica]